MEPAAEESPHHPSVAPHLLDQLIELFVGQALTAEGPEDQGQLGHHFLIFQQILWKVSGTETRKTAMVACAVPVFELAAGLGFEPRQAGPEPAVLPLHHPAMRGI